MAINCHDHRGKCQKSFKLYSFPVIFAYVMGGMPIIYNQQYTTDHLFRFTYKLFLITIFSWVNYLINPLQKVQNVEEFQSLMKKYDYLVVSYIPIKVIIFISI